MAETNVLALEAYRSGTEALKAMNKSLTGVADVVDELHEAMQMCEEVEATLGENVGREGLEAEELERELQALLSSPDGSLAPAREEGLLAEQLSRLELISVPTTHPSESTGQEALKQPRVALALH
jgi:hypothetical protein